MTSVPFALNVTIRDEATGRQERYDEVAFRFTTKSARALERAAGSGIGWLLVRGQSVEALVLLLCYGLQWQFPKMNEARAVDIVDAFVERDGNVTDLSEALKKALNESGLYGKPDGDEPRPTMTTAPEPTTVTSATP